MIRASHKLGVNMVTTFIGRDPDEIRRAESWSSSRKSGRRSSRWPELGVKIAIENCPMLRRGSMAGPGQNLMTTPPIWRRFRDSTLPNLGINYDPSHFVWQQIDYETAYRVQKQDFPRPL
ncbi:MAG: TIM barrel protein [Christensenellales bacterium]